MILTSFDMRSSCHVIITGSQLCGNEFFLLVKTTLLMHFVVVFSSWGVVRFVTMGIKICLTLLSLKQPIDTEGQCIVFTYFLIF